MPGRDRDGELSATAGVLRGLVERGCLSQKEFALILRAALHAEDPHLALGFAAVVTHHDPRKIPIAETVDALIGQNRRYSLLCPPERWLRKSVQLRRLRQFTPPPVRYTDRAGWLERVLPADRRHLRVLDTPNRLLRESLRQGFGLNDVDPRLRLGRLAGISVLAAGKRWTVTLHAPTGCERPRLHRIRGAGGAAPDERSRSAVAGALGETIDMTPPSRRAWRAIGRVTTGGLGLAALLALAPLEPPASAPGIPEIHVCAAGLACYAIRHLLPEQVRCRRLSAGIFAAVWLGPALAAALAILAPIPVALDGLHAAEPIGRQLLSLPLAYLAAALAWPPIGRWWHRRPGRAKGESPGTD